MNAKKGKLKFLLDEGVPNSVGQVFEKAGHEVLYVNKSEVVLRSSPDQLIAKAAMVNDLILVALDGDMRDLAHAMGYSNRDFKSLSLVKVSCSEPEAAERVEQAMELIENEWEYSKNLPNKRIFIEIRHSFIKTNR